ncbi:MAG: FAD-binding oxidoreductase, partial [Candidatus Acidiferrum sp.]
MNSVSRREFLLGISTLPYTVTAVAQSLTTDALKALRSGFGGELILPTDSVYESARRTNNHAFDRHPLLIARCTNADDVARVLEYARSKRLPIAVRSGGHCQAGRSSLDGGVVIDLSKMNAIVVDSPKAEVQCGAGVRVFEANRETAKYDLALPLGICGDVGVAGLTLGGGYGYLLGVAGLACDSLISARLVLADGRTIEVSDQKEPDLMWALRGA